MANQEVNTYLRGFTQVSTAVVPVAQFGFHINHDVYNKK